MENYGSKINIVAFIFIFVAGEFTRFYTNSKKRLLSVVMNRF